MPQNPYQDFKPRPLVEKLPPSLGTNSRLSLEAHEYREEALRDAFLIRAKLLRISKKFSPSFRSKNSIPGWLFSANTKLDELILSLEKRDI